MREKILIIFLIGVIVGMCYLGICYMRDRKYQEKMERLFTCMQPCSNIESELKQEDNNVHISFRALTEEEKLERRNICQEKCLKEYKVTREEYNRWYKIYENTIKRKYEKKQEKEY